MATLTGKAVQDTYKDLLQVSNSNSGIDGTLRTVDDGEGTSSPLRLSNTQISLNGLVWPSADGSNGQALITNGAGGLSFGTPSGTSSSVDTVTAGEALSKGDLVYMHTDGKVYKADNNDTLVKSFVLGSATAVIAEDATGDITVNGVANNFAGLTVGSDYYLDGTAGGVTTTAPTASGSRVVFIGRAMSATEIDLKVQFIVERA